MGRILGPRGMTTKQLEQETGCKIMVRGKGSMRDKKKVRKNGISKIHIYLYLTEHFKHFHNNYNTILLLLAFESFISLETRFTKEK